LALEERGVGEQEGEGGREAGGGGGGGYEVC